MLQVVRELQELVNPFVDRPGNAQADASFGNRALGLGNGRMVRGGEDRPRRLPLSIDWCRGARLAAQNPQPDHRGNSAGFRAEAPRQQIAAQAARSLDRWHLPRLPGTLYEVRALPSHLLFDVAAPLYDWFTAQQPWRESCRRIAAHLPERQAPRVLDLAAGPGVSSIAIARARPDARLVALDRASRMVRRARRAVHRAGLGWQISVLCADVLRVPFADGAFDGCTGHSVLYLLPDQRGALLEVARVLRPGGRAIFMEPHEQRPPLAEVVASRGGLRFLVSVALWRAFSRLHGRYTPGRFQQEFTHAGLRPLGCEQVMGGLGLIGWAEKPVAE